MYVPTAAAGCLLFMLVTEDCISKDSDLTLELRNLFDFSF